MVSIGPLEIDFRFGRRRRSPLIYLIALVLLGGAWLLRSDPSWVRALEEAVAEPAATSFQLSEHTGFEWDRVHIFPPYTGAQQVDPVLGAGTFAALDTEIESLDGIVLVIFCNEGKVVSSHDLRRGPTDLSSCLAPEGLTPEQASFRIQDGTLSLAGG